MSGATEKHKPKWRRILGRIVQIFAVLLVTGLILLLLLIGLYRYVDPPFSALMVQHRLLGKTVRQRWVPMRRIPRNVVLAVVSNEDARFCKHRGVDWGAIRDAVREAWRKRRGPRGASTIPMQTVKNMFLWARSYVRKVIEIPLAYIVDLAWPKRRTAEIYLNFAEWAPGVFGVEAAARHHFRKKASGLSRREAALLAAALPNPYVRHAGRPGPRTRRLASIIERRMPGAERHLACVLPRKR